jgi:hypothetical protein
MAAMPKPPEIAPTAQMIYDHYAEKYNAEPARPYLGGSAIGMECQRSLWYSFHWVDKKMFDGRLLRLFQRGHREEPWLVDDMRACGMTVWPINPTTKKQWSWTEPSCGHHFAGNGDGILKGVPEAPVAPHLWECKTHATKSWNDVKTKGVEASKPQHFAQMQIYMHWTLAEFGKTNGCNRALYTAVCKETDHIHVERVRYDEAVAQRLIDKAHRIIFATSNLPRMSEDPTYYECKWCDHHAVCHGDAVPQVNCRTCIHSTPTMDGQAVWTCGLGSSGQLDKEPFQIPVAAQRVGCDHHRFIPALLENWATAVDGSIGINWVKYEIKATGKTFVNGAAPDGHASHEIHAAADKNALTDPFIQGIRSDFDAHITG